jgi:hypothetical protein
MNQYPEFSLDGLPEDLAKKVFEVAREFRTNPLSFVEGGTYVVVEHSDGEAFLYDCVKDDIQYMRQILNDTIWANLVDIKPLDNSEYFLASFLEEDDVLIRKYIKSLYVYEYSAKAFRLIWNNDSKESAFATLSNIEQNRFLESLN